jgi:hypothetical protein
MITLNEEFYSRPYFDWQDLVRRIPSLLFFLHTAISFHMHVYIYICIRIDSPRARFARGCSWRPSVTVKSMGPLTNTKWRQKAVWSNLVDTCPGSSGQYVGHYPTSRGAATAWWQDVLCLIHQQVFKYVQIRQEDRFMSFFYCHKLGETSDQLI